MAAGSSMVTDPKINADDTGRLVSGTDANGNAIPPGTFVGAVSDTGPVALGRTPAHGRVQQLRQAVDRDVPAAQRRGQPVTLPNGYNGNVTLSAEGATSTVGSTAARAAPRRRRAQLPHRGSALRRHRLHARRRRHRQRPDQPVDQARHGVEHLLQPLQLAAHDGGPAADRPGLHQRGPVAGTVCGGLDGEGHVGYAAQQGLADFGPECSRPSPTRQFIVTSLSPGAGGTGSPEGTRARSSMRSAPMAGRRKGGRARTPGPPCALSAVLLAAAALAGCGGGSRYPAYLPKRTLDA